LLDRYNVSLSPDFSQRISRVATSSATLGIEGDHFRRSCQTLHGGDDSILTPEDQWKYTTAN